MGGPTPSPPDPPDDDAAVGARPRRPPARARPEALAAARGGAREGLAWLGRPPEARASRLWRLVWLLARFVLFGLFRFRIDTSGQEHLPAGGYIVMAAAHRGWMDPVLVVHAQPLEPRSWFLGSGPAALTSRWREWLYRRVGGLLPVWRGGVGIDRHVEAARAVLAGGGVLAQMPEGTVSGPPGRLGPFRHGAAVIALRTGAPIVPIAMAGSEELYLGKRLATRVLPPTSVAELAGPAWDGVLPPADSRQEIDLARRISDGLAARLGPVVAELHRATLDAPGRPRRLRRQLTFLFMTRGGLGRDWPEPD